jgi:hypothetical protein
MPLSAKIIEQLPITQTARAAGAEEPSSQALCRTAP